jgi:hypothetical protein
VRSARRDANAYARRYPNKGAVQLNSVFNYKRLIKRFGKVEDFGEKQHEYKNWTFWAYAKRSANVFGSLGDPILRQVKRHRQLIRNRAKNELIRAVNRRDQIDSI